jgi:hypothetical protein
MHYAVGQSIYGQHTISEILEGEDCYEIYIEKEGETKKWKSFNKNMGISVEYNLDF